MPSPAPSACSASSTASAAPAPNGWGDTWTIASLAAGLVLLAAFLLIESRVEHPLLPVRVFTNRTRAASFVAMFFAPAAMFAMFFYLSQYIQTVMGYSPLAGRRRVPPVLRRPGARGRHLVQPDQPDRPALPGRHRHPDGRGRPVRVLPAALRHHGSRRPTSTASYATDLLPFILLMAFGMGMTFVPLTLTAVHHLRDEDTGIGSGVLNTMQQVGGALGLSLLARWRPRRSPT